MSMDLNRIGALLHIVEKSRQYPSLKPLHDMTMKMLEEHAREADGEMKAKAEAEKEQAAREAAAKAEAEERSSPRIFPRDSGVQENHPGLNIKPKAPEPGDA